MARITEARSHVLSKFYPHNIVSLSAFPQYPSKFHDLPVVRAFTDSPNS